MGTYSINNLSQSNQVDLIEIHGMETSTVDADKKKPVLSRVWRAITDAVGWTTTITVNEKVYHAKTSEIRAAYKGMYGDNAYKPDAKGVLNALHDCAIRRELKAKISTIGPYQSTDVTISSNQLKSAEAIQAIYEKIQSRKEVTSVRRPVFVEPKKMEPAPTTSPIPRPRPAAAVPSSPVHAVSTEAVRRAAEAVSVPVGHVAELRPPPELGWATEGLNQFSSNFQDLLNRMHSAGADQLDGVKTELSAMEDTYRSFLEVDATIAENHRPETDTIQKLIDLANSICQMKKFDANTATEEAITEQLKSYEALSNQIRDLQTKVTEGPGKAILETVGKALPNFFGNTVLANLHKLAEARESLRQLVETPITSISPSTISERQSQWNRVYDMATPQIGELARNENEAVKKLANDIIGDIGDLGIAHRATHELLSSLQKLQGELEALEKRIASAEKGGTSITQRDEIQKAFTEIQTMLASMRENEQFKSDSPIGKVVRESQERLNAIVQNYQKQVSDAELAEKMKGMIEELPHSE